ncbi:hypothetical protein A2960_01220 [Candidatus Gottesmanbacteria bacterium RIFCSPLOWO2_01_FULL_39_12b]|uniref:NYN domain-containing protein n=1 Tax=Candidatus Gottesmanbacteria bacterium RIFCSPLOWO2_01_FULL_39_12b TaxID=1798388 RepID=A0A1F6AQ10_9BACT|nr:MAG: hypothetical protein A2960_01220 [Candidatus Gottesmanbacteria bacterium RIFCSPLOWO2_01_FULL_39_12b]
MKKPRSIILVDGSNFYFKLKDLDLHHLLTFDFFSFAKLIAGKHQITQCTYYVGAIRTDGTTHVQRMFTAQRKLLAYLKKHKFTYSLGYLLKTNNRYHEKGVDVNIAVDMLVATYEDLCDRIILVSSDTDLLPAIKKAKEKGKTVQYIGFSHQPSLAMIANCTESRLLGKEDLLPFIKAKKITPSSISTKTPR